MKKKQLVTGSALILTIFILAGMMIIAFSGSYIVLVSLRSSQVQSQSIKAYFAAETGAEQLLYELRQNDWDIGSHYPPETGVFTGDLKSGPSYQVNYINFGPIIFNSVGEYQNTKRNVEIRLNKL
ncbi:MAG: pilus assembly PilX N-terminal domain-containing protein [Patescibacteria group bacterium]|jgi:hypothetical protein